jgi:hypothetical protein
MRALALLALLLSSAAQAAGPSWPLADMPRFYILGEGNAHFSVDSFYFHTKENYDNEGQVSQPPAMDHVRYGNLRLHGAFGFSPRVSIFAQADARALFMMNSAGSNVSDDENYGFGDAFLGFRWMLYRSSPTDKVYPSEWSPHTLLLLAEGSWLFPMYAQGKPGKPPLGDQSNDFTSIIRGVWYASDWLGLAANAGYLYRTAGYSALIPWGLRADFNFLRKLNWRFWIDFQAQESTLHDGVVLNPDQPDPIQSGSLLFKSDSPTLRAVTLGTAILLGKEIEVAAGGFFTASGINTAKGFGGALGLAWRPYQVPELKYEDFRREQLRKLENEPKVYRQHRVLRYGLKATVIRVSNQGNFFQIAYGSKNGIKAGDYFQVFSTESYDQADRQPLALARVQVVRGEDSFLRVDQRYEPSFRLKVGMEAQRVIIVE